MMSVAVEFATVMLVAAEFTLVVSLRQRSVGSYSLALLGSHMLQTLVACLALRYIVFNELLHFGLLSRGELSHGFLGVFFVCFLAIFTHFFYSFFTLFGCHAFPFCAQLLVLGTLFGCKLRTLAMHSVSRRRARTVCVIFVQNSIYALAHRRLRLRICRGSKSAGAEGCQNCTGNENLFHIQH